MKVSPILLTIYMIFSFSAEAEAQGRSRIASRLGGSQVCSPSDFERDPDAIRSQDVVSAESQEIRRMAYYLSVKIETVSAGGQVISTCSGFRTDPNTIGSAGHCFLKYKATAPEKGLRFRAVLVDHEGKTRTVPLLAPQGKYDEKIDGAVARLAERVDIPRELQFPPLAKTGCDAPREPSVQSGGLIGALKNAGRSVQRSTLPAAFMVGYGVINQEGQGPGASSVTAQCPKIVPVNNIKQHGQYPALWVDFDRTRETKGIQHGKGCFGDSGSAVLCKENGKWVYGGIVSAVNPNRDSGYQDLLGRRARGEVSSLDACRDSRNTGFWNANVSDLRSELAEFERASIAEVYTPVKSNPAIVGDANADR